MPVIIFFILGGACQTHELTLGLIVLLVGHFVSAVIDFLIIAFVVFWILKALE
jgi:large-conductance mechanosensitive channel